MTARLPIADVAIVGAGPGGAFAAYRLARRGLRVRIFDASHPREKPCGGGVTGRALELVGDALDRRSLSCVPIRRARFVGERDTSAPAASVDLSGSDLIVTSREHFDRALLQSAIAAGATHLPLRIRQLARRHGRFHLIADNGSVHDATFVVGADGANSFVRRTLLTPFRRHQLSIATGFFARGVTSHEIVIELTSNPPGYFWSFPRPDHLAIGVCAQADSPWSSAALRDSTRRWIQRTAMAPDARLSTYAWPIPSLGRSDFQQLTVSGPGWALIGDAAGLVDPITREGIFFALQSADFLADAITSVSSQDAEHEYEERVRSVIGLDLAEGARLKAAFFRPSFLHLLIRALAKSERIRGVMTDLVAGHQPYRTLKRRLISTLEWQLAWALLRTGRG